MSDAIVLAAGSRLAAAVRSLDSYAAASFPLPLGHTREAEEALAAWESLTEAPVGLPPDHRAAHEHLTACWEWYEEHGIEEGGPASGLFDGCCECQVREVLWAARPFAR